MKRITSSKNKVIVVVLLLFAVASFLSGDSSKDIKYLVLEGSAYQRGLYHGKTLKADIGEVIKKWKEYLKKSRRVEADVFIKKFLEKTDFQPAIKKWTPELLKEVKGISDGSGIDFDTIYAFQLLDEIWVNGRDVLANHHCTTIGVNRQGDNPTLAAQNMDIPEFFHDYRVLFHIKHKGSRLESFVLSIPGWIGLNGMNNRPVSVQVNALQQLEYCTDGLPVAFIIRGLLAQDSHKKAVEFIHTVKHASGQNYIISGIDKALSFECSARKVCPYIPFDGAQITYHTNHPLVNDNYSAGHLERLKKKGKTVEQGFYRRDRFHSLEKRFKNRSKPVGIKLIKSTMASRDTGRWDICNAYTFACTITVLSEKPVLLVSPGPPDVTSFKTFRF